MEAKIECDLIFIRAAEEIAGLSWKAGEGPTGQRIEGKALTALIAERVHL